MSFMFHPYPYADPNAVNPVTPPAEGAATFGALGAAQRVAAAFASGKRFVGLDGYAGAEFSVLRGLLEGRLPGVNVVSTDALLKPAAEIRALIAPSLPTDRAIDPVLLYGVRVERRYEDFFDPDKLAALARADAPTLVIGQGALCDALRPACDLTIWADITPRTAALNFKYGKARNLGEPSALPFGEMMRRNYYVDFELAVALRWKLVRENAIDLYISADDPVNLVMIDYESLRALFREVGSRPLRCRPVYLEGVWGGFYMKRLRRLPDAMRNCAWIFDMIPMEVSLAMTWDGRELETPFFTFVQEQGERLLGKPAYDAFGGYFPVRFNYDDTFHASGNMSIQCHPDEAYVMREHGELGRQDESYYVCVAGQNACTYLGFENEDSCEAFFQAARQARDTRQTMDYQRYVHAVPSAPGTQVMIPAGTIHASGQNQVILEIGSLTVGSYTYKLYDYQRVDPQSGLPRPIHLEAGEKVIRGERTARWVEENLVNHGGVVRETPQGREVAVGEHELLYFALHTLTFQREMDDDTGDRFHVLALTEGERVRVESKKDPGKYFTASYLDVVVVPASFGPYRLVNEGVGPVTVHKTALKQGFAPRMDGAHA